MHVYILSLFILYYGSKVTMGKIIVQREGDDHGVEGYYWRDFTGSIPKDAFPGGKNLNGNVTYIGQVLHRDKLIPAKIDPEDKKAYYEWGFSEFVATKNFKILCTSHPDEFEWISTTGSHISTIPQKFFIMGGYEEGVTILIGRKQLKNEVLLGKVVISKTQSTLNISKDAKVLQYNKFEVLIYNPNNKTALANKTKKNDNLELAYRQKGVVINIYNT